MASSIFPRGYFPSERNLIKNYDGLDGLADWNVTQSGGDGFSHDEGGARSLKDYVAYSGSVNCWATSYEWCTKSQMIDLHSEGYRDYYLDQTRPDILVSEWIAPRSDCASLHHIKVVLFSENRTIIDVFQKRTAFKKGAKGDWSRVDHTFSSYEPGLRYIEFTHSGKGEEILPGHHGSKMALPEVKFSYERVRLRMANSGSRSGALYVEGGSFESRRERELREDYGRIFEMEMERYGEFRKEKEVRIRELKKQCESERNRFEEFKKQKDLEIRVFQEKTVKRTEEERERERATERERFAMMEQDKKHHREMNKETEDQLFNVLKRNKQTEDQLFNVFKQNKETEGQLVGIINQLLANQNELQRPHAVGTVRPAEYQ